MSRTHAEPAVTYHQIDSEHEGQRLDNYLLARLKGVPRSHVYRLIRSGQVRVNKGRVHARYRLQAGDSVRVPPVRHRPRSEDAVDAGGLDWLERRIIFENQRFIVIDKPSGLAVHGGSGVALGCIEGLRSLRPSSRTMELAHRLDRMTSGCLLVAKRRSALHVLHRLFREGRVDKGYLALVAGDWQLGSTIVDAPIGPSRSDGRAKMQIDANGKPARSEFRLVERFDGIASLMEVKIATGRMHQIRVHAAYKGHPVLGDDRYGDDECNRQLARFGLRRMFLHAHTLSFDWPESEDSFSFSAPLPDDLVAVLDALPR